jgi:hypothetical protein
MPLFQVNIKSIIIRSLFFFFNEERTILDMLNILIDTKLSGIETKEEFSGEWCKSHWLLISRCFTVSGSF